MWYFIVVAILFILSLFYRVFTGIHGLVLGIIPAWMAYIVLIWLIMILVSLIFAFRTWRLPEDD